MKKLLSLLIIAGSLTATAQLQSSSSEISFYSENGDITAKNTKTTSSLNNSTGGLTFDLNISDFIFENSTMQKHFNQEDVMNSVEFPSAKFEGTIVNNNTIDYTADGTYKVTVKGSLTIKGVSKDLEVAGKVVIKAGKISANSSFSIDRTEYGVDGKKKSVSQVLAIKVNVAY